MFNSTRLNIQYEVKDLVRTIDFYNILFGEWVADLYPKHAVYAIKDPALTLTFTENPTTDQPVCGNFNLFLKSDEEVYNCFRDFTENDFSRNIKIDPANFTPGYHAFFIKGPNGLIWELGVGEKRKNLSNYLTSRV
jgi:hypothetical protein